MGILIKGKIPIPSCCEYCPAFFKDECSISNNISFDTFIPITMRHPDCPLQEIKVPHGKLVEVPDVLCYDMKELEKQGYNNTFDDGVRWLFDKLDDTFITINAEE